MADHAIAATNDYNLRRLMVASGSVLATALSCHARIYALSGRYPEAEPLYIRALAINEQVLGATHPDTATSLNNLALLYCFMGRYGEALPLFKRSLSIREQVLGATHPDTATTLNNLAFLYKSGWEQC